MITGPGTGQCNDCDEDYHSSLHDSEDTGMPSPGETATNNDETIESIIFEWIMEE